MQIILRLKKQLGLKQTLKMLGISFPQFYQWQLEVQFDCFDSFSSLCLKNNPRQLNIKEIQRIKKMLLDPNNNHWPVVSIAAKAMRDKKVIASHYSWYKYAKIFDIKRKLTKKDRKKIGIIAKFPNEYWHCDLTYYQLINGKHVYITFLMDNFSKMILGYHVRNKRDWHGTEETIKMALLHLEKSENKKMFY